LGQITLAVQFGTADHFRIDYINFIVVDFEGTYHAILGRLAPAKFMAIPHYVYLLQKMPIETGVLSLRGNVLIAYNCEKEGYATAEVLELSIRMQQSITNAKKIPPADLEIPSKEATRAAAKSKETKGVELVLGNKSKTARIGATLDPK
jgi:recombinational DNA repair protein RecR